MRAAAARRRAEAEATSLLELIWDPKAPPIANPIDALQALAGRLAHAANVLGARLEGADLDGATSLAWSRVLRELRLALDGMARLDIDEKFIQLESDRAQMVVNAFTTAIDILGLPPGDRSLVVGRYLDALEYDGDVVETPAAAAAREVTSKFAGAELAGVVRAVLDDLNLTDEQWGRARIVVPREFRRVSGQQGQIVAGELE